METHGDTENSSASYPTNWSLQFLCDCKKKEPRDRVHPGIAKKLSANKISILSDHSICHKKKLSLQLTIPPLLSGDSPTIIKAIGHSIETIASKDGFLTEVEFLHFIENGRSILAKCLHKHFNSSYTPPLHHFK